MLLAALVLAASALAATNDPPGALEALAAGDDWYARRAEGGQGGTALPGPVEAAIAAYRRSVGLDPQSWSARCRLMRALYFRANFCGPTSANERRSLLEEARATGDRGVAALEAAAGGAKGAKRIEALRRIPGAAELYFWTAVSWGEWALQRGKLAAARQGAGPKIRDLAQMVVDLDPDLEQGGGYRILGRLHAESPKIPFITGWVSRREALTDLRRSLERGPENTMSQLFLAEAILDHDPARKEEARQLLQKTATAVPRPEYLIEDAYYIAVAKKRLAQLR